MIVIGKISKGHKSIKNVSGVKILLLCMSSDGGLVCICTKFHENILDRIKVTEQTRFS